MGKREGIYRKVVSKHPMKVFRGKPSGSFTLVLECGHAEVREAVRSNFETVHCSICTLEAQEREKAERAAERRLAKAIEEAEDHDAGVESEATRAHNALALETSVLRKLFEELRSEVAVLKAEVLPVIRELKG